ncbi:hypothetical protein XY32_002764 [Salmonella enterica subsp. enterica]|nr:hypothetical protein [Salmonella enterica subsp. enterica serovar Javiana]
MTLSWAKHVVLERKIARWVWEEKRAITLPDIAEHFGIDAPSTWKIVRSILRRTDGIKCSLESRQDVDNSENKVIFESLEVYELPDSYQPFIRS